MAIMIYALKRDFAVQRAERFFKERRVPFQMVDLKKHLPGEKELLLFARAAGGVKQLLDMSSAKVKEHPAAYAADDGTVLEYLKQEPSLMRLPFVRDGNRVLIAPTENELKAFLPENK